MNGAAQFGTIQVNRDREGEDHYDRDRQEKTGTPQHRHAEYRSVPERRVKELFRYC